jgi:hypothetical protein
MIMSHAIDCAVLMLPAHESWMRGWIDTDASLLRRFNFHPYPCSAPAAPPGAEPSADTGALMLRHAAPLLRRFDLCLLPVTLATLGWSRTALACVQDTLVTPVLGLLVDIKAPAVADLLALGMRDFVRYPACPEEFRVRATQAARRRTAEEVCLNETSAAYADGVEQRGRPPPALVAHTLRELEGAPHLHAGEAFRSAKSRVVGSFERDYLRLALQRHHGNVARAARASSKHRRAFWALMRKHGIDASVYRRRPQ